MAKKKNHSRTIKLLLLILLILLASFIILSLINDGYIKKIFSQDEEPKLYTLRDKCSLILDNIIHQFSNEGECRILCNAECDSRNKQIVDSEFISSNSSCHTCDCYCKE